MVLFKEKVDGYPEWFRRNVVTYVTFLIVILKLDIYVFIDNIRKFRIKGYLKKDYLYKIWLILLRLMKLSIITV